MNNRMAILGLTVGAMLLTTCPGRIVAGPISDRTVAYKDGEQELEGYLAYDSSRTGKLPGVLVVHEWWGLTDYPKRRARQLAQLGYVAFAADIYGKGVLATTADAAGKFAGTYRADRDLMRRRVNAALAVLKADPRVDSTRVAAIGYCFGGTCVLELVRGGADLAGVGSFHGLLDTPHPEATPKPKAAILVCHGAADPYVSPESLTAFCKEMNRCDADWQLTMYGEAVHSFTNPDSGGDPSKGVAYNAQADQRSWADMARFFDRIFAKAE
jgi:dienelactone hydrolase